MKLWKAIAVLALSGVVIGCDQYTTSEPPATPPKETPEERDLIPTPALPPSKMDQSHPDHPKTPDQGKAVQEDETSEKNRSAPKVDEPKPDGAQKQKDDETQKQG